MAALGLSGWQAPQPPTNLPGFPLHPGARDPLLFALPHLLPSSFPGTWIVPALTDRTPGPRELPGARRPDDPRQGRDWMRNRCHASGVDASTLAPESLPRGSATSTCVAGPACTRDLLAARRGGGPRPSRWLPAPPP